MKQMINSLLQAIDNRPQFRLWTAVGLSLAASALLYMLTDHYFIDDAPSYRAAKNLIDDASLDTGRTPLYPFLIALVRLFCSDPYLTYGIVLVQIVVFLASIPFFDRIAQEITRCKRIAFATTLCYACCPHIILWNRCTLTEPLAISGIVFFVHYAMRYVQTCKIRYLFVFHILLFLLIMLRPAFVYLTAVAALFWIYNLLFLNKKLHTVYGFSCLAATGVLLFCYAHNIQHKTGVFTLTTVTVVNKYTAMRSAGLLNEATPSSPISFDIANSCHSSYGEEFNALVDRYGYEEMDKFLRRQTLAHKQQYLSNVFSSIANNSRKLVFIPGGFQENDNSTAGEIVLKAVVSVNIFFLHLYLFLAAYGLALLYLWCKRRAAAVLPLFLWFIVCAHLAVVFAGSYGQYSRLAAPVYPLLILMFGQISCFISVKRIC